MPKTLMQDWLKRREELASFCSKELLALKTLSSMEQAACSNLVDSILGDVTNLIENDAVGACIVLSTLDSVGMLARSQPMYIARNIQDCFYVVAACVQLLEFSAEATSLELAKEVASFGDRTLKLEVRQGCCRWVNDYFLPGIKRPLDEDVLERMIRRRDPLLKAQLDAGVAKSNTIKSIDEFKERISETGSNSGSISRPDGSGLIFHGTKDVYFRIGSGKGVNLVNDRLSIL